jgi:hypothetical protein
MSLNTNILAYQGGRQGQQRWRWQIMTETKRRRRRERCYPQNLIILMGEVPSLIEFGRFLSYEKNDAPHCWLMRGNCYFCWHKALLLPFLGGKREEKREWLVAGKLQVPDIIEWCNSHKAKHKPNKKVSAPSLAPKCEV